MRRLLPVLGVLTVFWFGLGVFINWYAGDAPPARIVHSLKRNWNDEVTMHFMNTLGRYHFLPFSRQYFAISAPCTADFDQPCVSSSKADQPGVAIVSSARLNRDVVYTSFPPGAMVLTHLVLSPLYGLDHHFEVQPLTLLRAYNWFLGGLTVILFALALDKIIPSDLIFRQVIITTSCLPLLFSVEALHSHHLSLWSHQVLQPWIALVLLTLSGEMTRRRALVLGILCALGCWIEWSAYLVAIAVFVAIWWRSSTADRTHNLLVFVGLALLGGVTLLGYYDFLIGLKPYLMSQMARAAYRSYTDQVPVFQWVNSLFVSYGAWILVAMVAIFLAFYGPNLAQASKRKLDPNPDWRILIGVACFMLFENVLMYEHSIEYTFDHLKWAFLFGLVIAGCGQIVLRRNPGWIGLALACGPAWVGAISSISDYMNIYSPYWR
jgi:hypothetical protein